MAKIISDRPNPVPFNKPPVLGTEMTFVGDAIAGGKLCGDGRYSKLCHALLEKTTGAHKALLTTSCSSALEMSSLLLGIQPGDEVIVPSFTFSTSASAFALRGACLVFADIRQDTIGIDESKLEAAITPRTKAIVVVHYAGVSCNMDPILALAAKHGLAVVEDAAQALGSTYKGRPCGSMGDLGCFSFHETKNVSCGEGGALLVNGEQYIESSEIVWEKGTDRSRFFRGQVDKYTWVSLGSSYLLSEMLAAFLYPQLESAAAINGRRMEFWQRYYTFFKDYEGFVTLPHIPSDCEHNAHMFYLLFPSLEKRTRFIDALKKENVLAVFHYLPLHLSEAGRKYGRPATDDNLPVTCRISDTLVRLPLYYNMEEEDFVRVLDVCRTALEGMA